jgi:hypothetical protein
MLKHKLCLFFTLASFLYGFGQIERSILNTCGKVTSTATLSLFPQKKIEYSIGEPITFSQLSSGKIINNGFIQPDGKIEIGTGSNGSTTQLIPSVFPNPSDGSFSISINLEPIPYIIVHLIDSQGKLIQQFRMEEQSLRVTELKLSTGIYFLNFYNSTGVFIVQKKLTIL